MTSWHFFYDKLSLFSLGILLDKSQIKINYLNLYNLSIWH